VEAPKVFISYSHDSSDHAEHVLALSDKLRQDGIDCHIDQYEISPPEGWPRWMSKRVKWANFVVVVCTETYNQRFTGEAPAGQGKGVKWEGAILTQELYDAEAQNTRFIPVVLSSQDTEHIPVILRGQNYYDISTDKGYEALYRHLTNQPRISKPALGKLKSMPPLKAKQDEASPEENKPVSGEETQKEPERRDLKKADVKSSPQQSGQTLPKVPLRSKPIEDLSKDEVEKMLRRMDFYSGGFWSYVLFGAKNKRGKGINHQYDVIEREGEKLVIDHTTGLTWQQSGSPNSMVYADALKWIEELKKKKFAGYDDWRLPTLEEAMSLMETEKKNGDLYISEVFDRTQRWIWTADKESGSAAWVVAFLDGSCNFHLVGYGSASLVRAVR
jgi:hypothetical protein